MARTTRIRSAVLLGAAALALVVPTFASHANLVYIAGRLTGSEALQEAGNDGMAVGAAGAGAGLVVGAVSAPTGVGAAVGGAMVVAGGITAGLGG